MSLLDLNYMERQCLKNFKGRWGDAHTFSLRTTWETQQVELCEEYSRHRGQTSQGYVVKPLSQKKRGKQISFVPELEKLLHSDELRIREDSSCPAIHHKEDTLSTAPRQRTGLF